MVEMLDLEYTNGKLQLPARDGDNTVSYALGILSSIPIQGVVKGREGDVLVFQASHLRQIARNRVAPLGFGIGQTVFWIAANKKIVDPDYPEGWPSLYSLTAVAFPDDMHMEEIAEAYKHVGFPAELVVAELERVQHSRAAAKVFG
jgi:hypothetical protein